MATADYIISNQSGASFRTDLNNTLAAIVSNNSNSSSPSTTYAYQWWADTSNNVLKIRNSANNGWIELLQLDGTLTLEDGSASTPALAFRDDLDTGIFSGGANEFNISTGGTERFVINSNGNVGIGETSPSSLGSGFKELIIGGATEGAGIELKDSDANVRGGLFTSDSTNAMIVRTITSHPLMFRTANTVAMTIDSSQRVGIGTTSPTVTLDIESNTPVIKFTDSNATGTPECEVSGAGGNLILSADKDNEKADTAIICQVDGSTVISVTSNSQVEYEVGATSKYQRNTAGTNSNAILFNSAGSLVGKIMFNNSQTIYSPSGSDRTLKKNFENWTESVLPLFKNLTPQKFNFTQEEDSETKHKGFIAQDEVANFPEAYPKDPETDKYLYSPNNMVVYLMKAIQELEAKVAALEAA